MNMRKLQNKIQLQTFSTTRTVANNCELYTVLLEPSFLVDESKRLKSPLNLLQAKDHRLKIFQTAMTSG